MDILLMSPSWRRRARGEVAAFRRCGHGGGKQKERFTILEAGACPRVEQTRLGFTLALAKPRALQCSISGDAK